MKTSAALLAATLAALGCLPRVASAQFPNANQPRGPGQFNVQQPAVPGFPHRARDERKRDDRGPLSHLQHLSHSPWHSSTAPAFTNPNLKAPAHLSKVAPHAAPAPRGLFSGGRFKWPAALGGAAVALGGLLGRRKS